MTRRDAMHRVVHLALVAPVPLIAANAHASTEAPAPPPPGATPLTLRGAFDVVIGAGLASARADLGQQFAHADFQRWRVSPATTWAQIMAHYTSALGAGWSVGRSQDAGDLRLQEWSRGWLFPRRFAVSLLDRVIETSEGSFKVLYVAIPASR